MRTARTGLSVFSAACCLLAASVGFGDPPTEALGDAIDALERRANYRWTTAVEVPEGARFRPGPTTGSTERGGRTHATLSFGRRTTHVVIEGDKAAVTGFDGDWEVVSLSDKSDRSSGFAAAIARSVQTPATDAREIVSELRGLREEDGEFVGSLSTEAAKARLVSRRRDEDAVRDAKGTARFRIEDGLLAKLDVRVEGAVRDGDEVRDVWRRTTTEVVDVGTTKPDLPPGATEALGRSIPESQPRLSDQAAAELLDRRGKRDVGVHDPSSIVKCGDEYWFFSTGFGVSSWRSRDLRSWQRGPRVFRDMPAWVRDVVPDQRGHFWAPDVIRQGDRYLLYYSVSSFGKNTSAIALASTPTLDPEDPDFHWTDHGIVVQSERTDDFNAIDPAVIRTPAGELWMSFGSFWSGLKLVQLDPKSGKRSKPNGPMHSIARRREIEAPHISHRDGWYYLFVNWDKCCRGVDSTYNIRVGRSREITGPYLDREGVDLVRGGGTLLLGTDGPFIGPGHANVFREADRYWFSCHFYDGTERGRSKLSIQELTWDEDGWPVVAEVPSAAEPSSETRVPTDWVDPKTGHRVVRLSKEAGSASLYFHQNAYSPDGKKLLISTPGGLSTVDLRTRELELIVPRHRYTMGGSSGVEVGRRTPHVYYSQRDRSGVVVRATHLDTGETRDIVRLPAGASLNGVNADETLLFGTIQERPGRGERGAGPRRWSRTFYTASIESGEIETFHQSEDWLNHGQCSPADPGLALFCHEGPWHEVDRIWTIRLGSDEAKLMHRRQQRYEIAGHEFFGPDGQWIWYDLQTPRSAEFWLAAVNVKTGERVRYAIEREWWSVHYNVSPDGKLFAGDGGGPGSVANHGPLPEKKRFDPPRNGQWIYLFRPRAEFESTTVGGEPARSGTLDAERLVDLSDHDYSLEPNVTFTPDGRWVVFRSNMHGERHVYAVRTEREHGTTDGGRANPDVLPDNREK